MPLVFHLLKYCECLDDLNDLILLKVTITCYLGVGSALRANVALEVCLPKYEEYSPVDGRV